MIRFIEIVNNSDTDRRQEKTRVPAYSLSELWINDKYVISIKEALIPLRLLREGYLPPDLSENHKFTLVTINNGNTTQTHTVIGDPSDVARQLKLSSGKNQLLKG